MQVQIADLNMIYYETIAFVLSIPSSIRSFNAYIMSCVIPWFNVTLSNFFYSNRCRLC